MSLLASELATLIGHRWPRRRKSFHQAKRILCDDPPIAYSSPLQEFDARREHGTQKIVTYCRYVRTLITADGVANALGLSKHTAVIYLETMTRAGLLRAGRNWDLARRATVWEWIGGEHA